MVLDIEKTSDRKAYPKGGAIPRTSLTTLQLESIKGFRGENIGVTAGILCGLVLGGDLVAHTARSEAGAISSFLGIAIGSGIVGQQVGKKFDRKVTIVKILREP